MKISSFEGEYEFLSNFYESPVTAMDGVTYPTNEHAFQAMKTEAPLWRKKVLEAKTPGQAKRVGREVLLRPDWEMKKIGIMEELLRRKFTVKDLRDKLIATGDAELIEGNHWNDKYWGVDAATGEGRNELGKALMKIRSELVAELAR